MPEPSSTLLKYVKSYCQHCKVNDVWHTMENYQAHKAGKHEPEYWGRQSLETGKEKKDENQTKIRCYQQKKDCFV